MDWPRVKTILIALLLVVDLALGGYYFYDQKQERDSVLKSIENVKVFVESEGIEIDCDIPSITPELALLPVTLEEGQLKDDLYFADIKIEVQGNDNLYPVIDSEGGQSKKVDTASKAIIKFYQSLDKKQKESGCTISNIELVYLVDLDESASKGQKDTATPSWKLTTSIGVIYFNAYTE